MAILAQIFEICIVPLLTILVGYLVTWIQAKKNEIVEQSKNEKIDKYATMLADTITSCVLATNQTYVSNLKADNLFDAEAQKTAFTKTYEAVMATLTEDAKKYLKEAYGDLNEYISQKIEAEVLLNK